MTLFSRRRSERNVSVLFDLLNLCELRFEVIEEKRINDLVDIFDRGIVHAAGTTCLRVQGRFEDRTEDSRRDFTPIEVVGSFGKDEFFEFVREARHDDFLLAKQTAVHVGESGYVRLQIWVAFCNWCVEQHEQVHECATEIGCAVLDQIVVESGAAVAVRLLNKPASSA